MLVVVCAVVGGTRDPRGGSAAALPLCIHADIHTCVANTDLLTAAAAAASCRCRNPLCCYI